MDLDDLLVSQSTVNSSVYQPFLESNVRPCVRQLKLVLKLGHHQDNDPKHGSKSTTDWLKKKTLKVRPWSGQSPELNLIFNAEVGP